MSVLVFVCGFAACVHPRNSARGALVKSHASLVARVATFIELLRRRKVKLMVELVCRDLHEPPLNLHLWQLKCAAVAELKPLSLSGSSVIGLM